MSELRPDTAAYIAGIIDGEGTITLTRVHSNECRRLVVSIANTELPLLQYVLTPRNGKYTPELSFERTVFEQTFLQTLPNRSA